MLNYKNAEQQLIESLLDSGFELNDIEEIKLTQAALWSAIIEAMNEYSDKNIKLIELRHKI